MTVRIPKLKETTATLTPIIHGALTQTLETKLASFTPPSLNNTNPNLRVSGNILGPPTNFPKSTVPFMTPQTGGNFKEIPLTHQGTSMILGNTNTPNQIAHINQVVASQNLRPELTEQQKQQLVFAKQNQMPKILSTQHQQQIAQQQLTQSQIKRVQSKLKPSQNIMSAIANKGRPVIPLLPGNQKKLIVSQNSIPTTTGEFQQTPTSHQNPIQISLGNLQPAINPVTSLQNVTGRIPTNLVNSPSQNIKPNPSIKNIPQGANKDLQSSHPNKPQ